MPFFGEKMNTELRNFRFKKAFEVLDKKNVLISEVKMSTTSNTSNVAGFNIDDIVIRSNLLDTRNDMIDITLKFIDDDLCFTDEGFLWGEFMLFADCFPSQSMDYLYDNFKKVAYGMPIDHFWHYVNKHSDFDPSNPETFDECLFVAKTSIDNLNNDMLYFLQSVVVQIFSLMQTAHNFVSK